MSQKKACKTHDPVVPSRDMLHPLSLSSSPTHTGRQNFETELSSDEPFAREGDADLLPVLILLLAPALAPGFAAGVGHVPALARLARRPRPLDADRHADQVHVEAALVAKADAALGGVDCPRTVAALQT